MSAPELPPLHWVGAMQIDNASFQSLATEASVEGRERILLARIAELQRQLDQAVIHLKIGDDALALVRSQRDAANKEVRALRAEMKAHGITPEDDDDVEGW